jgi:hypothetical protein
MSAWTMMTGRAIRRTWVMPAILLPLTAGLGSLAAAPQAALAGTSIMAIPVAVGPIVSGYHTAKCVDDLGNSHVNDTPVVISDCNGSAEQDWTVDSDGTIQINGKCLDIYRERKTNRAPVELWTCTGKANQQWQAAGSTLVNPISGKCLDDPRFNTTNGTQLALFTCNGGKNQLWELPKPSVTPVTPSR